MVTKQEALEQYNIHHKTEHTLTSLAIQLLQETLREAWMNHRRQIVLAQIELEEVEK